MSTENDTTPEFQQTIRYIRFKLSDKAITLSSETWMEDEKRLTLLGSRLLRAFSELEREVLRMTPSQVDSEWALVTAPTQKTLIYERNISQTKP